jgi:hypothetical protein
MTNESHSATLARKLRLKPGQTALALGAPALYAAALREILGSNALSALEPGAPIASVYDVVSFFARERADVARYAPAAIAATRAGGSLWMMWPKKSSGQVSDLDRDNLWALIQPLGWGPVASVAIDQTWSALRFRPEHAIHHHARP